MFSQNAIGQIDSIFLGIAVFSTVFFLLRAALLFFGGIGIDADGNGIPDSLESSVSSDGAFKLLSLDSSLAFLMMLGWVGLAGLREYSLGAASALGAGLAAGFAAMGCVGYLFMLAGSLASPGECFKLENSVGQRATVYQRIPACGMGKIQVSVNGMLREIQALSIAEREIPSFETVVVARVIDSQTVAVRTMSK